MPTSKKKKGKKRGKRAPPQDAGGDGRTVFARIAPGRSLHPFHAPYDNARLSNLANSLPSLPPRRVVDAVERCDNLTTEVLTNISGGGYFRRLFDAGLIDVVLGLLGRCENEQFTDVLVGAGANAGDVSYLSMPAASPAKCNGG